MTKATTAEAQAVQVAIPKDSTLYETIYNAIARVTRNSLSDSMTRDIVDAAYHSLGHDDNPYPMMGDPVPYCGPDAQLLQAVEDLLTWAPEGGYAQSFGEFAMTTDDARFYFAETPSEYQTLVDNGEGGDPLPLLSQPITYAVLGGKHSGRGFMSRVNALRRMIGLDA